ncbi:hypothetical protein SynMINOS11_01552 [Synechococcus sp. Minos11]|nr:hypothetical protein SynMINOS11_01552 [Synechococcus sp. Minos11]
MHECVWGVPGGGMDSRNNFRSPNCKRTLRDVTRHLHRCS